MIRCGRLFAMVAAAFGVALVSQLYGYTPSSQQETHFYVIAARRGFDVDCSKFTTMVQVNDKTAELNREAAETNAKNAAINKDIADLNKQLAAAKSALAFKKDAAEKEAAQQKVDELQASIKDKTSQLKPAVVFTVSRAFTRTEDADAFISNVEKQAAAMKAQAEKEAAAKEAKEKK